MGVDRLHEACHCLSVELKRRAEVWENALAEGNFEGLDDALANGGPTFAQVTCQVESPAAKSPHEVDRGGADDAHGNEHKMQTDAAADLPAPAAAPTALQPAASTSILTSV